MSFSFEGVGGVGREGEPVRFCVPLEIGVLMSPASCCVIDANNGVPVTSAITTAKSTWRDGSVRWLDIQMVVDDIEGEGRDYALMDHVLEFESQPYKFEITSSRKNIGLVCQSGSVCELRLYIVHPDGTHSVLDLNLLSEERESDSFKTVFRIRAEVAALPDKKQLIIFLEIKAYAMSKLVDIEVMVHNPSAAKHAKGLWDLGDPRSVYFLELGVEVLYADSNALSIELLDTQERNNIFAAENTIELEQLSSGCVSDARTDVTNSSAFRLISDGEILAKGSRADGLGVIELPTGLLTMNVQSFWQQYPSALRISKKVTTAALFASPIEGTHEIQPGERKRRNFSLHLGSLCSRPARWLAFRQRPPSLSALSLIPITFCSRSLALRSELDIQLQELIVSTAEFFSKRELIDEYGWRNFGEVFADHENLYRDPSESTFISHYNNQYDLVLGFGLQFLRTADTRWFELMDDLAKHVVDIDIYHTADDRVEYNHGLFWHTNHYQDAGTATHRTFSRLNYDPADPGGTSGGPGPEHCYTSGLVLHYLLCSDSGSKKAVIGLAEWMHESFHGGKNLLGQLHSIAKHELPFLVKSIVRSKSSIQNESSSYAYPLTRGTGNLIVAYLDAYFLSCDRVWLDFVESVLRNTFHPDDEVDERMLDDVENTWSSTIFLQAVLRYLSVKEELGEIDANYEFARRSFSTYSRWLMENAVPYLAETDKLEFANDTWAAQDIRRCIIFDAAAVYDNSHALSYKKKAKEFSIHVIQKLSTSETLYFTRIQAIILQNIGMSSFFAQNISMPTHKLSDMELPSKVFRTVRGELRSAWAKLIIGMHGFSLKAEIRWLLQRL